MHIYIFSPKLLRWNFIQISQLPIWNGVHKLFCWFLDFSKFSNAISRKLWRHLAMKMRTIQCIWKNNPFWKKALKPHQNRPINRHTILVWTMSPTRRQTKRDIQKTPIFAPTAGARSSISPKLCMLIENVVTIVKDVNHFSIQRIVFPARAKMLIFGHWLTE